MAESKETSPVAAALPSLFAANLYVVEGKRTQSVVFASPDRKQVSASVTESEKRRFAVRVWRYSGKSSQGWQVIYDSEESPGLFGPNEEG